MAVVLQGLGAAAAVSSADLLNSSKRTKLASVKSMTGYFFFFDSDLEVGFRRWFRFVIRSGFDWFCFILGRNGSVLVGRSDRRFCGGLNRRGRDAGKLTANVVAVSISSFCFFVLLLT